MEKRGRKIGHKVSKKTKLKISNVLKGKSYRINFKHTKETKEKISKARKGCIAWNKGIIWSEDIKKKISISTKIAMNNNDIKEKMKLRPPSYSMKNKKHSLESILKMSNTQKMFTGTKAPNWRGGKSFEHYGIDFNEQLKRKIRKRDNYACQKCNRLQKDLGYKLCVHHIDYNKKNCNEDNLISLCINCHVKTNFKRNYWKNYFKNNFVMAQEQVNN